MIENFVPQPLTITDLEVVPNPSSNGKQELRTIAMQFNPTSLTRNLSADYVAHAPIGFTGKIEQYVGNSNTEIPLDIFYSAVGEEQYAELTNARHFLEAVLFPSDKAASIQTNAPPKLLLVWPNNLSIQCRARNLRITDEQYDTLGRVLQFSATLTVFEVVERRISKEVTKDIGPRRRRTRVEI